MSDVVTVDLALRWASTLGLDRLDATLLLAHRLGCTRTWLLAHGDHGLDETSRTAFEHDCHRRVDGVPAAYLVGRRAFHGLELAVSDAVLVPRPDTELLVDWALEWLSEGPLQSLEAPRVLDLGTGSGAIALAVAAGCSRARVTGTDRSEAALAVARGNGHRLGLAVSWAHGDWWRAVGDSRFDLVLANPPYVAEGDPHLAGLRHEPQEALVAGPDGLSDLRRIVAEAQAHVDGWLILEHGWNQADPVAELLSDQGARHLQVRRDLAGHARCTAASWQPRPG